MFIPVQIRYTSSKKISRKQLPVFFVGEPSGGFEPSVIEFRFLKDGQKENVIKNSSNIIEFFNETFWSNNAGKMSVSTCSVFFDVLHELYYYMKNF